MPSRIFNGASGGSGGPANRPSANACVLRTRLATAAVAIPLLVWLIVWNPASLFNWLVGTAALVGVAEFCLMAFPTDLFDRGFGMAAGALLLMAMLVPTQERFAMALAAVVIAGLVL